MQPASLDTQTRIPIVVRLIALDKDVEGVAAHLEVLCAGYASLTFDSTDWVPKSQRFELPIWVFIFDIDHGSIAIVIEVGLECRIGDWSAVLEPVDRKR